MLLVKESILIVFKNLLFNMINEKSFDINLKNKTVISIDRPTLNFVLHNIYIFVRFVFPPFFSKIMTTIVTAR